MSNASGKLVIIGILAAALAAAGTSWWFRYAATNRAAQFWGPGTARLIRDASTVTLTEQQKSAANWKNGAGGEVAIDISTARGLTHLRNALLEDRSFLWDSKPPEFSPVAGWLLRFKDPTTADEAIIIFMNDCRYAALVVADNDLIRPISCEPIAAGLREMFSELSSKPAGAAR
ncbi:MAG: hypothetical protein L0228_15610 [Planctomycetes bacterium]|nr:hypothetical protein [Planctomycetota bacterium]